MDKFILRNRFGNGSILKFKGDPTHYAFKNFLNDGIHVFVIGLNGLGTWRKRIDKIEQHNYKPVIKETKETNNNLLNLKEMSGGLSKNMSINDIAILHKVAVEHIKTQLSIGIPIETKDHTYDISKAKQIAMDHLVENPNYYTDYVQLMEPKEVLKEEETEIIEEPTAIVSEETVNRIDLKRDIIDIVYKIEDIIIEAEDWNNSVPIKINALNRLDSILKATRSLYLDLEASTKLFTENVDKEESSEEREDNKKEKQILLDKTRKPLTDELKELSFTAQEVIDVVETHYKVDQRESNMLVITVRNPHYDNKDVFSTPNYKLHIYYGNNYVAVYPGRSDKVGESLALKVEKEIVQDLAFMNGFELPDLFVQKHSEILTEDTETFSLETEAVFNQILNDTLNNKVEINEISDDEDINQEEAIQKTPEDSDYFLHHYELIYDVKVPETYQGEVNDIDSVLVTLKFEVIKTYPQLISQRTHEEEEEYKGITTAETKLLEVLVDGYKINLTLENKNLIKETFKTNN